MKPVTTVSSQAAVAGDPAHLVADSLVLTPAQERTMAELDQMLDATAIVALAGGRGSGRSTLLRRIAMQRGGLLLTIDDFAPVTAPHPAREADTVLARFLIDTLARTRLLVLDDVESLFFTAGTTRPAYMRMIVLPHLRSLAERSGKQLLFSSAIWDQFSAPSDLFGHDAGVVAIPGYGAADYGRFATNIAGEEKAAGIDFQLVYRFASLLNGHQLRMACRLLARVNAPDASSFIDILQRYNIVSANTRTDEVETLSLDSLPGHEHIADRLMTNIILPLENHVLAQRLGLKPKRGVLLYGPPGTGKTAVGRALAHRMNGKFFLIDGSFVSEPPGAFFAKVQKVVEEAKANSPSVLFIDDADVLFQIDHIAGLARYLLSLLDGLESEAASNVCVMMTAMNVRHVPEALLRSGRVELWLETKLPDEAARARILRRWLSDAMPTEEPVDFAGIAAATEGFTPADLRRLTGDARALYAADLVRERPAVSTTAYLHRAADAIVARRRKMADSLRDESLAVGGERRSSAYGAGIGGVAETGSCSVESGW